MKRIKDKIWHRALRRPYSLEKVVDEGTGKINILLVHGIGANSNVWEPVINTIDKEKYRVISYDLLGFGASPKPDWLDYSVNEHVNSLAKSLKKDLKPKQKIILLGHSMGCIVGVHLATKYPKYIDNIVLYQPPLLIDSSKKTKIRKKFYNLLANRPPMLLNFAKLYGRYSDKLSTINVPDDDWLPFERSMRNTILAQRTIDELTMMNKKIDIVYGRLDFVVSRVDAKKMAAVNPRIKLHYVNEMHDITNKSANYLKKVLEEL